MSRALGNVAVVLRILAVLIILGGLFATFVGCYAAMHHPKDGYPDNDRLGYGLYCGLVVAGLLVSAFGIVTYFKARSLGERIAAATMRKPG